MYLLMYLTGVTRVTEVPGVAGKKIARAGRLAMPTEQV
jgi:hypothetical protein